ncbi:MAG TPA: CYTH and CHAD domain-containing protein [Blastococcus sp.]|nr:CYTH and CHAD domain-containing protein [Blastococcus sp.]
MVTGHLEVERKFDVDPHFVLPELAGLPGVSAVDGPVEHQLSAVYHDSSDLRLLRARVTLRRRTGGADAGWHLKLPAGSARRELHAPLGRAVRKPPAGFLAPVAGILRGSAPGPVAALETRRTVTTLRDAGGRALAEVADDNVTATVPAAAGAGEPAEVHAWREVEVELVHGDEHLLAAVGELLAAAGARPSDSASKVGRVLAGRLAAVGPGADRAPAGGKQKKRRPRADDLVRQALADQLAGLQAADVLLRTEQPDAVHQLRVAARRLRSTLAAFRSVLDREATTPLREELSWLGGELAAARDDEVALAHLRELVRAQPVELVHGPVAARIQQTQLQVERAGLDRARVTLGEARYLRLLDDLHDLVADPPFTDGAGDPARPVFRDALARSVRRLGRRLDEARSASADQREEALHGVRKAAKRVRYTAEVVAGEVSGGRAPAKAAKRVQKVLGELQDTVVTREHSRRMGVAAAAAGENAFPYGRLHALEEGRAEAAEAEFWRRWPKARKTLRRATRRA